MCDFALESHRLSILLGPGARRRAGLTREHEHEVSDLPRIVARFGRQLPHASLAVVTVERMIASDGLATFVTS